MYLRHSTTCLSSITLNYVFIWNWMCSEVLLSYHFDWYLFPLVFSFWKVAEFQVNTSQRDIKVKPNRSCAVMPPLLLVRERNKLGFVHFSESFLPLYFFANPSFHAFCVSASRSLKFLFQSESSSLVRGRSLSAPSIDTSLLCRMLKVRYFD